MSQAPDRFAATGVGTTHNDTVAEEKVVSSSSASPAGVGKELGDVRRFLVSQHSGHMTRR